MSESSTKAYIAGLIEDARCFACYDGKEQLNVQTYLLAFITGLSTVPSVLAAAAKCLDCLTLMQLVQVRTYLYAVLAGNGTDPGNLLASSTCYTCIPPKLRISVQTYLLSQDPNSPGTTDLKTLSTQAKLFKSLDTKVLFQIQVLALASVAGISVSASVLISLAKCMRCLTEPELIAIAVQTLDFIEPIPAGSARTGIPPPPVVDGGGTDGGGGIVSPSVPVPTGLALLWNNATQTVDASWDTPPAGVVNTQLNYSVNSGTFPKNFFNIAAPGTTYSIAGLVPGDVVCVRIRFQTTGVGAFCATVCFTVPTLLGGLVSWWKFEEVGSSGVTRLDSVGTSNWTPTGLGGTFSKDIGIIDGSFRMPAVNGGANNTNSTPFRINSGESFTIAGWFSPISDPNAAGIFAKWDNANDALRDYFLGGSAAFANPRLTVRKPDNTTVTVTAVAAFRNTPLWNFIACGFDNAAQVIWIEFNGGARVTQACTGIRNTATIATLGFFSGGSGGIAGRWDEFGFWKRSLASSEVATLYNKGNAFAFPWSSSRGAQVASSWSAQVIANGAAEPSRATRKALASLVDTICLTTDLWGDKMIMVNPIVPDSLVAALTPILQNTNGVSVIPVLWTNAGFVAGDLSVQGLLGDGTSSINTGFNTQNLFASNAGFTLYYAAINALVEVEFGAWSATTGFDLSIQTAGMVYDHSFAAAGGRIIRNPTAAGYLSGNRVANNDQRLFQASSVIPHAQVGATNASVVADERVAVNRPFFFMANNSNGAVATISTKRISFVAVHKGLTLAESAAFYNAIQTFRQAIGGGFV